MTPVDTLGEPVTVVDALGEPVVLINNDGTPAFLAYSAKTYLGGVAPYHWLDFINNRALYAGADVGNVTQATGYTFSRASDGYYTNADGTLTLFGSGALRRGDRGVLIEGARTNLLTYSQQFDNAAWGAYGAKTITPNSTIAPDGTLTADTFTSTTAGNGISQANIAVSASTAYRFSLFVKAGAQGTRLSVNAPQYNAGNAYLGDLFSSSPNITAGTALANGWYRHDFGGTTEATTSKVDVRIVAFANNDAYIIWQADLQAAAFPSSPIVTVAAAATRAADVLSYTAGVSYPLQLWSEFERAVDTGGSEFLMTLSEGANDSNRSLLMVSASDLARYLVSSGAATQADLTVAGALALNTVYKISARTALNDVQMARGGTLGTQDTSALLPSTPTLITIGSAAAAAASQPFGYIRRIAVIQGAGTDANLQAMTS
jgi:hypothetical protein